MLMKAAYSAVVYYHEKNIWSFIKVKCMFEWVIFSRKFETRMKLTLRQTKSNLKFLTKKVSAQRDCIRFMKTSNSRRIYGGSQEAISHRMEQKEE